MVPAQWEESKLQFTTDSPCDNNGLSGFMICWSHCLLVTPFWITVCPKWSKYKDYDSGLGHLGLSSSSPYQIWTLVIHSCVCSSNTRLCQSWQIKEYEKIIKSVASWLRDWGSIAFATLSLVSCVVFGFQFPPSVKWGQQTNIIEFHKVQEVSI